MAKKSSPGTSNPMAGSPLAGGIARVTGEVPRTPNGSPKSQSGPGNRPAQNNATAGKTIKGPHALEAAPEKPYRPGKNESAPVATINSQQQSALAAGGSFINDLLGRRPSATVPARPGDDSNINDNSAGKTGGFPEAGGGSGAGRQPATVKGGHDAQPRTPFDDGFMQSGVNDTTGLGRPLRGSF
jgi:hypothetical protein